MKSKESGSIFLELLLLVFIVLKLTGIIEWSWLWVLSPIWIPLSLAIVIVVVWFAYLKIKKVRSKT